MKAEELRIGNGVHYKGVNFVVLTSDDFKQLESDIELGIIKPIHLTEEWLLKFGFEYSEAREKISNGFEEWNKGSIYLGDYNNKHYILEALDQGGIDVEVKYVHQLQNLYFALTGEELKNKL